MLKYCLTGKAVQLASCVCIYGKTILLLIYRKVVSLNNADCEHTFAKHPGVDGQSEVFCQQGQNFAGSRVLQKITTIIMVSQDSSCNLSIEFFFRLRSLKLIFFSLHSGWSSLSFEGCHYFIS